MHPNIWLGTCQSYENGCSPRPNLTHNRVTRLVWWRTLTRHENSGKTLIHIPGYLISPLTGWPIYPCNLSTSKKRWNSAEKYYGFWTPYVYGLYLFVAGGFFKTIFPYESRIVLLLFSYRSPIVLLSFSYCSPIVLLLFSYRSPIVLLFPNGER